MAPATAIKITCFKDDLLYTKKLLPDFPVEAISRFKTVSVLDQEDELHRLKFTLACRIEGMQD
jgi:hypothetical protein